MISGRTQQMYHLLPFQYFSYTEEDRSTKSNGLTVDSDNNYICLFEHHTQAKFQVLAVYERFLIYDLVYI